MMEMLEKTISTRASCLVEPFSSLASVLYLCRILICVLVSFFIEHSVQCPRFLPLVAVASSRGHS